MNNRYNEPEATNKFIVQANQTEANILLNPQPCRLFITSDTESLIAFDENSAPIILRSSGFIHGSGTAGYIPKFSDAETLENSPLFVSSGNLGFGTISASKNFEIVTSGNVTQQLTRNISSDGDYSCQFSLYQQGADAYNKLELSSYNPGHTGNYLADIPNANLDLIFSRGDNLAIVNNFAKPIWLVVDKNSSPKYFVMDSAGRIGVGTTDRQETFHVNGSMRWGGATAAPHVNSAIDGTGLFIENVGTSTANENIRIQSSKSGDFKNYLQFIIDPTSGFSFMKIGTGNCKVGVGLTNPSYPLTVVGIGSTSWENVAWFGNIGAYDDGLMIQTSGLGEVDLIGINNANYIFNAIHLRAGSTTGLFIDTSNRIGVGTISPLLQFQVGVNGGLQDVLNNLELMHNVYFDTGTSQFKYITDGYASVILQNTSGNILFATADSGVAGNLCTNNVKMTVLNNGTVCIASLAGSGTRNVVVDEDGNLSAP